MNEILKKIEPVKREKIINSAIDEFSKYPYNMASTNNIVKNAGISKGLLFHYFGSKKELYEYLSEFVFKKLFDEINENLNWEQPDIFERLKEVSLAKLKLSYKYPKLFDFVLSMIKGQNGPADYNAILEIYEKNGINIQELFGKFYHYNIDYSLFKEQENINEKIEIIRWTIEKFSEEKGVQYFQKEGKINFEEIMNKMDVYINVLKKTFY